IRDFHVTGVQACALPIFADGIVEFVFFNGLQDPDLAERFQARWDTPLTGHRMGGYYAMYHTLAPAIEKVVADGDEISRETIRAETGRAASRDRGKAVRDE